MYHRFTHSRRYFSIIHSPVTAASAKKASRVFTKDCVQFIETLHRRTSRLYEKVMYKRQNPFICNYRTDTRDIREGVWSCNKLPELLQCRHVEITGPANSAKMMRKALASSANGYMADMEDSMSPHWNNIVEAHSTIYDALRSENDLAVSEWNKQKAFFLRPRGLHLTETRLDPQLPATVADIGTHLFHNAHLLNSFGQGPFLYIPKLENYEDAMYIDTLLSEAEALLGLDKYTVKTTVLMETLPAIFQTHEIAFALRHRITAFNCGRWDYLFSMLKCLSKTFGGTFEAPFDRNEWRMNQPFMEHYVRQIVSTCYQRGILPIGGMSAFIPSKDSHLNEEVLEKVRQDKLLEIKRGCHGAWVAHPFFIEPIQELFQKAPTFITSTHVLPVDALIPKLRNIVDSQSSLQEEYEHVDRHISVCARYVESFLQGKGAVAMDGLMEDLATAEMSFHLLRYNYKHHYSIDVREYIREAVENIKPCKIRHICEDYILKRKHEFLTLCVEDHTKEDNHYIQFPSSTISVLRGRFSETYMTGIDLTKYRGRFMNHYWESNGFEKPYRFLGTTNGVSAVNVVAGGKGQVGPYVGGWQTNAMKNRLGMLLPDTLHVSPEEAATCAREINHHLHRADCVETLRNKHGNQSERYHALSMLADMEQGWNTPEKIRMSVKLAIENGINMIHIEDQGDKKRCGHLGDKELNTYDDYAVILRAANLAAQEILGPQQSREQLVRFIARTDAYSARRIHHSSLLTSRLHPEHKYVDWERGTSPDGKYLYLKQGINPNTGRTWGMDLSIDRCSRVVDEGLASHVWMETPDADLQVAKDFLQGVNERLSKKNKKAFGLYNHSPSFDWDVKFFKEAEPLAMIMTDFIVKNMQKGIWKFCFKDHGIQLKDVDTMLDEIQLELSRKGSIIQGDDRFSRDRLLKILVHGLDAFYGDNLWRQYLQRIGSVYHPSTSSSALDISTYVRDRSEKGFHPKDDITRIIVNQRLANFSDQLASFGYNLHLITLPEFHVTAFHMHQLSNQFADSGIHAFVTRIQRPERELTQTDPTYTYYKHQSATGTGVEAYFNECVGSSNTRILDDSTETADLQKRKHT